MKYNETPLPPCYSLLSYNTDSPFIFHIPHSSTYLPKEITDQFCFTETQLETETKMMGDLFTDELFAPLSQIGTSITALFSRIACDVERFDDDLSEPMSKHGMGAVYTHSYTKKKLRLNEHDRQKVLNLLYRPHHEKFSELVDQTIKKNGQVIIIDCHSFPSEKRWYEPGFKDENPLPDICIGTDPFHTPKYLSALMLQFFQEQGYSVAENFPFAGSITPLEHYEKTPSVYSIMVEINRKLYMDEHLCSKHSGFSKLVTQMAMLGERMGNLPSVYTCDRD